MTFIFVLILGLLLFCLFEWKKRQSWDWLEILAVSFGVGASLLVLAWLLITRLIY